MTGKHRLRPGSNVPSVGNTFILIPRLSAVQIRRSIGTGVIAVGSDILSASGTQHEKGNGKRR